MRVSVIQETLQAEAADLAVEVVLGVLQQVMVGPEIRHLPVHHKEILVVEMVDLTIALIVLVVAAAQVVQVGTLHLLLFLETVVVVHHLLSQDHQ